MVIGTESNMWITLVVLRVFTGENRSGWILFVTHLGGGIPIFTAKFLKTYNVPKDLPP
jgi:hypothetical protein